MGGAIAILYLCELSTALPRGENCIDVWFTRGEELDLSGGIRTKEINALERN